MAKIKPFKALRPRPELAAKVASVPYDVVDTAKARILSEGNPLSWLHVVRSEIDLAEGTDPYADEVYTRAASNLSRLVREGILLREGTDCLYLYGQRMGEHRQMSLVACCAVEDYESNVIRKHELTRADKEMDRTRHVDVTNANTGPVFLTYRADPAIDSLVEQTMTEQQPLYDFVAPDGVGHTVYRIPDEQRVQALVAHFARIERLYVADGHHRSASAARVGRLRRQRDGNTSGEREHDWFLAALFPHDQLQILPYNRAVQDLAGMEVTTFLARVQERFHLEGIETRGYSPQACHHLGMYLAGSWYRLVVREGTYPKDHPTGSLDTSILQNNLLSPLLGIDDPRTAKRIHFVGGIHGSAELERLVDEGGYAVAFALYPVSLEELMAVADADLIMPPKSTWFEPKLRSGLLVHELG